MLINPIRTDSAPLNLRAVDDHYIPELRKHYARDQAGDDGQSPNSLTNVDGFGIGWYSSVAAQYRSLSSSAPSGSASEQAGRQREHEHDWEPVVYKNTMPPLHDPNLRNLCESVDSHVVFGHIRAVSAAWRQRRVASPPRSQLPRLGLPGGLDQLPSFQSRKIHAHA